MNNLWKRVLVGVIGIPIAIGAIWAGGWWFASAIMLVSALGLREFYHLAESKNAVANQVVGIVWGLFVQGSIVLSLTLPDALAPMHAGMVGLLFISGVLFTLIAELFRAREHAILNTGITIAGVTYVCLSLATLIVLREHGSTMHASTVDGGRALVITLFASVWTCDSAAYFVGMKFGKHKLFPRVSPGKSWEGAIAGFVATVLVFVGFESLLMPEMGYLVAIGAGVVVGVVGQLGDLVESLLKRDATIKDSSQLIPGHGGVLDRFDSMLFAAPALLVYVSLVG